LYKINTIVDINNYISLLTKRSVGSYSLGNLSGNIILDVGNENETYKGIGKELINLYNLPVFRDDSVAFGSPTSDSEIAMVGNSSKDIITVIISFDGLINLEYDIEVAKELLLQYGSVTIKNSYIVG